jgi:hypothetical protein
MEPCLAEKRENRIMCLSLRYYLVMYWEELSQHDINLRIVCFLAEVGTSRPREYLNQLTLQGGIYVYIGR